MNRARAWLLASAMTLVFTTAASAAGMTLGQGIGTALKNSSDVRLAEIAVIEAEKNLTRVSVDQLRKQIQKAEDDLALAKLSAASARDDVAVKVEQAYFAAIMADEVIGMRESSLASAKKQLEVGKVKFKGGLSGKSDLAALEDNVASCQYSLDSSRRNRKLSHIRYNRAIGAELDAPVSIDDKLLFSPTKLDLKASLEFALANRRDILQATQNLARKKDDLKLASNEFTPIADQEQFKLEVEKASIGLETLLRDVRVNVEEAYARVLDVQNDYDIRNRAMIRAKASLSDTEAKYKRGLASASDIVSSEVSYDNSQLQRLQAINDYRNSLSSFNRAIGKPHPALGK